MSSSKKRVFVTGATGDVGSGVVRGLIRKKIDTTAYVRDEKKAKDLFKDELKSNHLKIVVGTYSTVDVFKKAIQGHTRLFLLFAAVDSKPADMKQVKGTMAKIAFEQGVRQIIDLSSAFVTSYGKKGIIGYAHTAAEEKLWALADENPDKRSLVVLRPGSFMNTQISHGAHLIKQENKLVGPASPSMTQTWIDTRDISDCAVTILNESIEKHDRNVYELGAEKLSHEKRAAIFSQVLGRPITYEQQSFENYYTNLTAIGLPHSFVYNFVLTASQDFCNNTTPEISLIIGRPLYTFEDWLKATIKAFQ